MHRGRPARETPCRASLPRYPRALPALFFAGVLDGGAGLAGAVLAVAVTGARAPLTASGFGFAGGFSAPAFWAGRGAAASVAAFAGFAALAFLATRLGLPP